MDWTQILAAVALVMMIVVMWPAYKYHAQNSPKAEKGDWASVIFVIGLVMLFVALLAMSVQ